MKEDFLNTLNFDHLSENEFLLLLFMAIDNDEIMNKICRIDFLKMINHYDEGNILFYVNAFKHNFSMKKMSILFCSSYNNLMFYFKFIEDLNKEEKEELDNHIKEENKNFFDIARVSSFDLEFKLYDSLNSINEGLSLKSLFESSVELFEQDKVFLENRMCFFKEYYKKNKNSIFLDFNDIKYSNFNNFEKILSFFNFYIFIFLEDIYLNINFFMHFFNDKEKEIQFSLNDFTYLLQQEKFNSGLSIYSLKYIFSQDDEYLEDMFNKPNNSTNSDHIGFILNSDFIDSCWNVNGILNKEQFSKFEKYFISNEKVICKYISNFLLGKDLSNGDKEYNKNEINNLNFEDRRYFFNYLSFVNLKFKFNEDNIKYMEKEYNYILFVIQLFKYKGEQFFISFFDYLDYYKIDLKKILSDYSFKSENIAFDNYLVSRFLPCFFELVKIEKNKVYVFDKEYDYDISNILNFYNTNYLISYKEEEKKNRKIFYTSRLFKDSKHDNKLFKYLINIAKKENIKISPCSENKFLILESSSSEFHYFYEINRFFFYQCEDLFDLKDIKNISLKDIYCSKILKAEDVLKTIDVTGWSHFDFFYMFSRLDYIKHNEDGFLEESFYELLKLNYTK